jgi:hemerythrin-like metal-binding protein
MAYFEWGSDLVIDGGPIDDDHRHLVDLVNELHTATSQGQGQTVVEKILDDLIASTQAHLLREEAAMSSAGFAHLDQHRLGHTAFVGKLRDLQRRYEGGSITVASQLSTLLRDWLSLHIRRSDRELAGLLKRKVKDARTV